MRTSPRGIGAAVVIAIVIAVLLVGTDAASAASTMGVDQVGGYAYRDSRAPGGPTFTVRPAPTTLPFSASADDTEVNVTLPFAFEFYGIPRTELTVSPNGAIVFPGSQEVSPGNEHLTNNAQDMIAPLWDDWHVGGRVGTGLSGAAPNRIFTISWVDAVAGFGSVDFQLQLFERGDAIEFHYSDVETGPFDSHGEGGSATVGIDHGTTSALEYSFNSDSLADERAIRFAPVRCDGRVPTIIGTFGADVIPGTPGNDVVAALSGRDTVTTSAGNDRVCAGVGNDTVDLGVGDDRAFGEGGADTLRGRAGDDRLDGAAGDDALRGGPDVDICLGRGGIDVASACETVTGVP